MQDFRGLIVWQKANELAIKTYKLTEEFPNRETLLPNFRSPVLYWEASLDRKRKFIGIISMIIFIITFIPLPFKLLM